MHVDLGALDLLTESGFVMHPHIVRTSERDTR